MLKTSGLNTLEKSLLNKYHVITLCGSTKFKNEFIEQQKRLTLEGNIVISVGLFGQSGDSEALNESTKIILDDIHKAKIDMSDEIFVINPNFYIGSSTKSEIEYAKLKNKKITYLKKMPSSNYTNSVLNIKKYPKFYIGQEVNSPFGHGIIVELKMPFDDLLVSPESTIATIWYGSEGAKQGHIQKEFPTKDLKILNI